jgi:hypothetical protein
MLEIMAAQKCIQLGCDSNIDCGSTELVLELIADDDGNMKCDYYFIDHSSRSVFWLVEFDMKDLLVGVRGITQDNGLHHISK